MALPGNLEELLTARMEREENVVGFSGDLHDGKVRIYVKSAAALKDAAATLEGYPVEYDEVGELVRHAVAEPEAPGIRKQKVRPLEGGTSIGPAGTRSAGTLGYFAKDKDGKVGLLTCQHVLPEVGKKVLQPGALDGGTDTDACATVSKSIDDHSKIDAAFAVLTDQGSSGHAAKIVDLGAISGAREAVKDEAVKKSGRTTEVTSGTLSDVNATIQFQGSTYTHQLVVKPSGQSAFSEPGDSGSAIVGADAKVVGLLWGGSSVRSLGSNIGDVEAGLEVKVI